MGILSIYLHIYWAEISNRVGIRVGRAAGPWRCVGPLVAARKGSIGCA